VTRHMDTIALENCEDRHLYRLRSRNLRIGVFSAPLRGFVGLRTKFDSTFLDVEYHWDADAHHGTACPVVDLGALLPEATVLATDLGTRCQTCGRALTFDVALSRRWHHVGEGTCSKTFPVSLGNEVLFTWLQEQEKRIT
jgi:hypothetical protein